MTATVWVTQVPNRRDKVTGALTPAVNISPASEHGELRIMMPPQASFFATGDLVLQLREQLRNYDYARGDSVICLGDPAIIAITGALLAEVSRRFVVLRWDKNIGRYVRVQVSM